MTLTVKRCAIIDGELEPVKMKLGTDLDGFESWRHSLWGSEVVQSLGVTLLPELRTDDIYCYPEQLPQLERDIRLILEHSAYIAQKTAIEEESIQFRANNILQAVLWAKEHSGGVIIW